MAKYFRNIIVLIGILALVIEIIARKVDPKKCLARNGFFPKPGSFCKFYYKCTNWIPVQEECPPGQHFDAIHGWCEEAKLYPCFEKPPRKECPRANGNFLKPGTGCKYYYQCCNGQPTETLCPEDHLFDPSTENCEYPELYTCIENIVSKELTSSPPTFVSTLSTSSPTQSTKFTEKDYETSSTSVSVTDVTTKEGTFSTASVVDPIEENIKTSTRLIYIYSSDDYTRTDSTPALRTLSSNDATTTSYLSPETKEYTDPNNIFSTTHDDLTRLSTTDDPITSITSEKQTDESTTSSFVESSSTINEREYTSLQTVTAHPSTTTTLDENKMSTSRIWDIISSTMIDIECPEPTGYFPHPTDKHKFIGCVDNHPSILTCPSNLVYKHSKRACVYE